MVALICFVLTVLALPFKSKSRLEAENAALRHQLTVLRRKVRGRAQLSNNDRWFFVQRSARGGDSAGRYSKDQPARTAGFSFVGKRITPARVGSLFI